MRKNTLKTKEIFYEGLRGEDKISLEYSILERDTENDVIYGIEIAKDRNEYKNAMLSNSKKKVEEIITVFYDNDVTPSTLIEILNDMSF